MDVSTIIVSYNAFSLTKKAITSVLESSDSLEQEVIVVDNDSPDGSGRRLREYFEAAAESRVHVIELDSNPGFAAGNNRGASRALGDVLFFLNPDTTVETGAVDSLYDFLIYREGAGAVGPHVLNGDGSDQESISSFPSMSSLLRFYFPVSTVSRSGSRRSFEAPNRIKEVDIVKGCALAVRRDAFESVGGWDESYFLYSEERELCLGLRDAGLTNFFIPQARIVHLSGASTSRINCAEQQVIQQRSALQFLKQHESATFIAINRLLGLLGFGLRGVLFGLLSPVVRNADFRLRGQAARRLFRWFAADYSVKDSGL